MSAATLRDIIALKAVSEPMLMSDSRHEMRHDKAMALTGILRRGCTCAIHLANGRPLSRAKANVWREVEALKKMLLKITGMRIMAVRPLTPGVETALRKT